MGISSVPGLDKPAKIGRLGCPCEYVIRTPQPASDDGEIRKPDNHGGIRIHRMKMRLVVTPGVVSINADDDTPQTGGFGQWQLRKHRPEFGYVKTYETGVAAFILAPGLISSAQGPAGPCFAWHFRARPATSGLALTFRPYQGVVTYQHAQRN